MKELVCLSMLLFDAKLAKKLPEISYFLLTHLNNCAEFQFKMNGLWNGSFN